MTATRQSYAFNRHLQYWDPCVDPSQVQLDTVPIAETRHAAPPPRWPECLVEVLDAVREWAVGRALLRHVRRRTTIYFQPLASRTSPDPYGLDDSGFDRLPGQLIADANRNGVPAVIHFDPSRTAHMNAQGLVRTPDISLAHELAHAVGITHGLHPVSATTSFTEAYEAPSQEEGQAVVLENMYRAAVRLPLRSSYLGNAPRWSTSSPEDPMLLALEHLAVRNYQLSVSALANELERLPADDAPYNPFRELRREWSPHSARRTGRLGRR